MNEKQEITKERIVATLNKIIHLFETGNVPKAIAIVTFPPFDVPSNRWSLSNRLIMFMSGTSDARGFDQWKKAGRYIKTGEKAFYILAPHMVKKKKQQQDEGKTNQSENEEYICVGFVPVPVFGYEQTDGEALSYQKIEIPRLPLMEKAQEWGIEVKSVSFQEGWYGYYRDREGEIEKIVLASPHEAIFFHELSHAAHRRVIGKLKPGQDSRQEIVAELSAQVLAHLVGKEITGTLGNSFIYIKNYADKLNKSVGKVCLEVLSEVQKVLDLILDIKAEVKQEMVS